MRTADGAWLCVMTTGAGHEGAGGQHIVAIRSEDHGATWSRPVDIEPADGPEASWGMPLITPSGRVYVFYVYNGDRITGRRADMLGWYCYRYSDDGGASWSARHRLPMRKTAVDRSNDWEGDVQIFWGIGKPIVFDDTAIFGFTKIGRYMLDASEGWFYRSPNLLSERDPAAIRWELLPKGDHGLRDTEHGSIQSEQNLVPLSNGDLYCMYRATHGIPVSCLQPGRRTRAWSRPEAATYTPGGRPLQATRGRAPGCGGHAQRTVPLLVSQQRRTRTGVRARATRAWLVGRDRARRLHPLVATRNRALRPAIPGSADQLPRPHRGGRPLLDYRDAEVGRARARDRRRRCSKGYGAQGQRVPKVRNRGLALSIGSEISDRDADSGR